MKLHLYKVYNLEDNDLDDPCGSVDVMTEKDLREEFLLAYNIGKIPQDLLCDYKQDKDYKNENWNDIGNLSVDTMIDIMNDICNYDCESGYYILETDIDIQIDEIRNTTK